MSVLLVFGLFIVIATAHNITSLNVPRYADPHKEAHLVCHYVNEKTDPPLHSVKWYKGTHEIFRFTPEQEPPTRIFNTTTGGLVTGGSCNVHSCAISILLPMTYNTRLSFTCEVSTEGPRFAVVRQTKNLTVAVILKDDPVIVGVPGIVQLGEDVTLNCSTGLGMPPANIVWYVDGKAQRTEPWLVNNTKVSLPNDFDLRSSWRPVRIKVNTLHSIMSVRCEATQPTFPPYTRTANASLVVARSPHLSMFTSSGSRPVMVEVSIAVLTSCLSSVHIFSKYSALSEV